MTSDKLPELPAALRSLEANLAALSPAGNLPRDELMYRAGWAACEATIGHSKIPFTGQLTWIWPLTTAALVFISATLALVLATRQPEAEIVYVEKPSGAAVARRAGDSIDAESPKELLPRTRPQARLGEDYLSLRERVLADGVDVLPSSPAPFPHEKPTVTDSRYGALLGQLRGG